MRRLIVVLGLLALATLLSLNGCAGNRGQDPTPTIASVATVPAAIGLTNRTPSTEAILGGGVRLYCLEACQQNFIHPFNTFLLYDDVADLASMPGTDDTRIIMAWVPASGRLYVNEEEIDTLSDQAQVDDAEFWSQYAVTAQTFFPTPSATPGAATADLAVVESPAEPVNEVHTFIGEVGVAASWEELALAMKDAGDTPEDLTQALLLVGELGRGDTANKLVILDLQIGGPTPRLACLQNPTWVYWAFFCSGLWGQ